ncbi:hypothetical protein COHA_002316 [Chlorella ohadii]|uniref:Coenzyme Q-binding protein COQ10 START domain-containing protein n=1 Tax=Chlorella ohadii TaxID=2649997 RepID=A0AAD5DW58_9CHLO|nr:hypothetical protein COHA_002316 [Chlorella ohadii]
MASRQSSHRLATTSMRSSPVVLQHRSRLRGGPAVATAAAALGGRRLRAPQNGSRWTCAQWLESSAMIECDVPLELAFALWEDRGRIPQWMPWITSVVVQEEDPRLSRWTLSTFQFGRQWEFSWLAQNLTPLRNQKIHWRSVPGSTAGSLGGALDVQNRGQIRFLRKGPQRCQVKLTISYEVPSAMAPFASLLNPVVEGILQADMVRFKDYAAAHLANTKAA